MVGNIAFYCLLLGLFILGEASERKLEFVQTIFRHGHRAPRALPYPNDPYDEKYWPKGWGQLTETGMGQVFELGQFFRRRYNGLLSKEFNADEIYVRSSIIKRTKDSARLMLLGLYKSQQYSRDSGSELLSAANVYYSKSIHSSTEACDLLVRAHSCNCTDAVDLGKHLLVKDKKLVEREYGDVLEMLGNVTGNPNFGYKFSDTEGLADITNEISQGLPQKNWVLRRWPNHQNKKTAEIGKELHERINKVTGKAGEHYKKYFGDYLMNDFFNNAQLVTQGKQAKRIIAYSSHDVSIMNLMASMGCRDLQVPQYASAIIMEVYSTVLGGRKIYYLEWFQRVCVNGNLDKCQLNPLSREGLTYISGTVDTFISLYRNSRVKTEEDFHKICEDAGPIL